MLKTRGSVTMESSMSEKDENIFLEWFVFILFILFYKFFPEKVWGLVREMVGEETNVDVTIIKVITLNQRKR